MWLCLLLKGLLTKFQVTLYSESYVTDTYRYPFNLTETQNENSFSS